MIDKLNQDDESRLNQLFEDHYGPAVAAAPSTETMWKKGAVQTGVAPLQPGDMDSLDKVEFMMAVEEEFHVEIPDAIAAQIDTRKQLEEYLGEQLDTKRRDPR